MAEIKQGYKQTDIGVIPENWEVKPIKQIFDICNNQRLPISEEVRKKRQGIFPYYGPTKIQDYINEYRLKGEYALIGEDGDHFLKWKDMPMTQLTSGKFNVNNHAHILKGKNNITITKWFYYFFKNRDITGFLARQGASRYKLSKATLSEIPCAYPTQITEQIAIATVLIETDALIATLDKKIVKKQQIKQGAMQQLLTGKKRLPGFSGEWVKKKIIEIGKVVTGSTPSRSNLNLWNGDFVWVSAQDFKSKYIIDSVEKITKNGEKRCRILPPNSVLVTCIASIGLNALSKVACATNQQINSVVCNSDNESEFLYYQISNNVENLKMIAGQTAVPIINKGQFESFTLMFPNSKTEQTAIAQILTDMDNEIAHLEKERNKYKELKAGMMQVLLTGKVRLV